MAVRPIVSITPRGFTIVDQDGKAPIAYAAATSLADAKERAARLVNQVAKHQTALLREIGRSDGAPMHPPVSPAPEPEPVQEITEADAASMGYQTRLDAKESKPPVLPDEDPAAAVDPPADTEPKA